MGVKGYKAFNKGMICRGKQYAENAVFEEDAADICRRGMHFVVDEEPLAVLEYYPLVNGNGEISEFAEVEALDEAFTDDNKKYCTKKLRIGAKIDFPALVKVAVSFEYEKNGDTKIKCTSSDGAQIGSSGYGARIGSSGYGAVIMCAGYNSIAKAKKGSWITLAEWENQKNGEWIPIYVKTEQVDGERIKEDTFYRLVNGKFTEV